MAEAMAPDAVDAAVAGQILGISRTAFKEGVARTTIRLYEGATPLTLIEEKLEGDASVMMRDPSKRAWLLEALRDVERKTGTTLFRTPDDGQVTDGDIKEAWSHLGQGYFVGRSKKGDDQMLTSWKQKGFRQVYADILGSKAGPAMQAYGTFFRSVWRRGAELNQMRREGMLDADLEGALRRSLGMGGAEAGAVMDNPAGIVPDTNGETPRVSNSSSQEQSQISFSIGPQPSMVRPIDNPTSSAKLHGDEARNPKTILRALTGEEGREGHTGGNDRTTSSQRRKHGRGITSIAGFMAWADAHGRHIAAESFPVAEAKSGGGEHLVFPDPESGRVVKITKPGLVGAQGEDAGAYIQRWMLANEAFGDDVAIEGIVTLPGEHAPRVVISQPFRKGRDATEAEIGDYLRGRGFHEHEGRWIHPIRGIKVWDTITPGNVIITEKGPMAVDLQVEPASGEDLRAVREKTGFGKETSFSLLPGSPEGTDLSGSQQQPSDSSTVSDNPRANSTNIDSTIPIPYVQQHGQSTERRRDAQAALRALLARAEADAGANARADAAERIRAESESLVSWARESGWLIEPTGFARLTPSLKEFEGGAEHQVFGVLKAGRVMKITRPPNFGARGVLPSYLKNIQWSNALFHDDIRIEGVIETKNGPAMVVSQPFISGRSPSVEEVAEWFEKQGYMPAGENRWKHPDSGASIADAHVRNFIMTDAKELVPVDLQVLNPGKEILEQEKREQH